MKFLSKTQITLSILLIFISGMVAAQPGYRIFEFADPSLRSFSVNAQIGTSSYYGDLCASGDCATKNKPSIGGGITLRLNDYFFFNFQGFYYRIEASDAESGNLGRMKRNLSFRADNYEFSFLGNFEFLNYNSFRYLTRKEFPLSAFLFAGAGLTTNNPSAFYNGNYVALRPLQTEQIQYSPVAAVIPFGLGVAYRFTDVLHANLSIGYRYCFSDYLDDVSTVYSEPGTFSDPLAESIQYRGDEVPNLVKRPPPPGAKRGNPGTKDGYVIISVRAEYKLPKIKLDFLGRMGGAGKMGAPKGEGGQPIRKPARRRGS